MPLATNWGVIKHSETGTSHLRENLPNQDAIDSDTTADGYIVLAIADGHGDARSFRSNIGAKLAAEAAKEASKAFLDRFGKLPIVDVRNAAEQYIPGQILKIWKGRVSEHFGSHSFSKEELDRLEERAGTEARLRAIGEEEYYLAYGTTLLGALLGSRFLLAFQLGDGNIVAASDITGKTEHVIPKDESLVANETTSLCQERPKHSLFRWGTYHFDETRPPGLVMLSTDGYFNAFASEEAFLRVGRDFLDILRNEGAQAVEKSLPTWLEEASREGSGDDITVGIAYRLVPALGQPEVPDVKDGK
jgi:serine/threonine protein phosphatase PrpC